MGRPKKDKTLETVYGTSGRPVCPDELSAQAKDIFEQTCDQLDKMGTLSSSDEAVIAGMSESYAEWLRLVKESEDVPRVSITSAGNEIQSPIIGAKNKAADQYAKFADMLGLSPKSRGKLDPPKVKDEADLGEFLSSRPKIVKKEA